jgi:polar amino acid transport system substrate-binding protein
MRSGWTRRAAWRAAAGLLGVLGLLAPWRGAAAEELRVAVDSSNPPFMFERDGRPEGLYPVLLAAVFREMGEQVEIEARPWPRAISELEAGRAGVAGIYKNSERLQKYDYSAPLFIERVNVYVRAGTLRYAGLSSLDGQRVGVIRGWSYGDAFDAARRSGSMTVEQVASDEQNLRKLEAGRLDAMLAIDEAMQPLQAAHARVRLAGTLVENPTFLAFDKSAGMTDFLDRFNAALARLRQRGDVDRIVAQELTPH